MILALYGRADLAKDAGFPAGRGRGGAVALAYNVRRKDDVDAVLAEAKKAGARILGSAEDKSWGGYSATPMIIRRRSHGTWASSCEMTGVFCCRRDCNTWLRRHVTPRAHIDDSAQGRRVSRPFFPPLRSIAGAVDRRTAPPPIQE
jgi:hypothetical protein